MAFPTLLLSRQSLPSQLPLSSLLLLLTKDMSRWNKAKFGPFHTSKHQQGSATPKRGIIACRKGAAGLKQIEYVKEQGPTQKLGWLCYAIRKDKVILSSPFFLTSLGREEVGCTPVCVQTQLWLLGVAPEGRRGLGEQLPLPGCTHRSVERLLIPGSRKQLLPLCMEHTLCLAGNFNSMGLIPVIMMAILDWHNCENWEVVLHSHCYL